MVEYDKIKEFLVINNLPLPGSIIYLPRDRVNERKLLRYEINADGIFAIVEGINGLWIKTLTIEQLNLCIVKDL